MTNRSSEKDQERASPWAPERLTRTLLDSVGAGIVVYDRELRYRLWNRFMEERSGIGAEHVLGRNALELFPHLKQAGIHLLIARALDGETVHSPDAPYWVASTGRRGWFAGRYQPHRDDEGDIIGVVGIIQDVTERRESEERLGSSERRFRTITENATEMIAILGPTGDTLYESPSNERVLGYSPAERIGRSALDLVHADDRTRVLEAFDRCAREPGVSVRVDYRFCHKDGSWRTLSSLVRSMLDDPSVRGVVVNSRDITERLLLQTQLAQSQKLEAVGRLAGGVAHDFNNLLTVIKGNAQLVLTSEGVAEETRREVEEIVGAAERAAALTRQLLAFSRQQVLQPRVLDLNEVVANVEKLLARVIGADVRLVATLAPDLGRVRADPGQIEQVLLNLAVNARDAMPHGGSLVVETSNAVLSGEQVRGHAPMTAGSYVRVSMTDDGIGMDVELQGRIFEPFFTTKEQGKGTGLGLSTVYGIVKQSGGFVWVQSEPGHGATFEVYLPRVDETTETPAAPRIAAPPSHGKETVLVVEDEALVRALVRRTLQRAGYVVFEAANGQEAMRVCESLTQPLDLLLTDVVMPGIGGRELVRRVLASRPATRVLFMSGYADDAVMRRGILEVGAEFLQKPFTLDELRARVRALLDRAPQR